MSTDTNNISFLGKVGNWIPMKLMYIISKSFFRNVKTIGMENIPINEPSIICANHCNQFMDGINLYAHGGSTTRPVKFIIAAKSYRRPVIGHLARFCNTLPVERPQDLAKVGSGQVISIQGSKLIGENTKFNKEVQVGMSICIKGITENPVVKEIVSDTELVIGGVTLNEAGKKFSYKVQPKINQTEIYNAVSDSLNRNELIGIFPEGGSSDRTDILPLKAGVCIMALEAMCKYNKPVNIICCGFNYFKAHKFRSRVIMEFGEPYKIPMEYIELYKKSKRDAIAQILQKITYDLKSVLYPTDTYQELTSILLARSLFVHDDREIDHEKEIQLNKKFVKAYNGTKNEHQSVKDTFEQVALYRKSLKDIGLTDKQVKNFKKNFIFDFFYFLKYFLLFIISFSFALPGVLLNYPVGMVLVALSETERKKCLKQSNVKVKANDVVASHQVKLAIMCLPLYHCFFCFMMYWCYIEFTSFTQAQALLYTFLFFVIYPFYSYRMLKATDRFVKAFKNMNARFLLLVDYDQIKTLRQIRRTLKDKIRAHVSKEFQEVVGDDIQRIMDQTPKKKGILKSLELELNDEQFQKETFSYLEELGI